MNWQTKLVLASTVMTALTAIPSTVMARTVGAFQGVPDVFGDYVKWTHSNGTMTNISAGTERLCVPLIIDATNASYTVTVNAYGPTTTSDVSCFSHSVYDTGVAYQSSGWKSLTSVGSNQSITLSTVKVPTGGNLYVCCDAKPNARVNSVKW